MDAIVWAPWSKDDQIGLARYISPDASRWLRSAKSRFGLKPDEIVKSIYEALVQSEIKYVPAMYHPSQVLQEIRTPAQVLSRPGEGTCLDLATLFCGLCLANDLLPFIIVLRGHALAAVSLKKRRKEWDDIDRDEKYLFEHGPLSNVQPIREKIDSQALIAIECTGFASSDKLSEYDGPECRERVGGLLSFERSIAAGREQLDYLERPFSFALDVAIAHYSWRIEHYRIPEPPDSRAMDEPRRKRGAFVIPQHKSNFFTGRDAFLLAVHDQLQIRDKAAISGLGGLGKTQVALEYIRRHRHEYDPILWLIAENEEKLSAGFVEIARYLELPQCNAEDQSKAVAAAKEWLTEKDGWLLVADNADDPAVLSPFFSGGVAGRILLTSRAQVFDMLGISQPLMMPALLPNEALEFLLLRTGRADLAAADLNAASELARELGYLPLALEQAAAYIMVLQSTFEAYLKEYRRRQDPNRPRDLSELALLQRGKPVDDETKSVTTTWQLAFDRVSETPVSADLLHAIAFLSPDRIPDELILRGASKLGPLISQALPTLDSEIDFGELLQPLTRYSLVTRNSRESWDSRVTPDSPSQNFSVHRLVQKVTRWAMTREVEALWIERVIAAVSAAFPVVKFETWKQCERILPHAQMAAQLITERRIESAVATRLLDQTGTYLLDCARYVEAERLFERALAVRKRANSTPADLGGSFYRLARLRHAQVRYAEAQQLYNEARAICESAQPLDHGMLLKVLSNVGELYTDQGRYLDAEPVFAEALSLHESHSETADQARNLDFAEVVNNVARLNRKRGRFAEAADQAKHALEIRQKMLPRGHPVIASSLNDLALIYHEQGNDRDAEPLFREALAIRESALGPWHPDVATILSNVALIYREQGRSSEAEEMNRRALEIDRTMHGQEHAYVSIDLNSLASVYFKRGEFAEAQPLFERSLEIRENALGRYHPDVATALNNLGAVMQKLGKFDDARERYERALEIRERMLGPDHPDIATTLKNLARLLVAQGKCDDAQPLFERAAAIRERLFGPDHPKTLRARADAARAMSRRPPPEACQL